MAQYPLILVTGVTGYIGGSLVPRLLEKGYRVRMLVRDAGRLSGRPWLPKVELVEGDIFYPGVALKALEGAYAAYYFIHNMKSGRDYYQREIDSARNFAAAASANGLEHIIYLGGLADPDRDVGLHLLSRLHTGNMLRQGSVPVTEFRASLIIGSGSISFELIRYLCEQIPLMIGPAWMHNRTQPIAIQNVLDYLVAALEDQVSRGKIYEIGGKDILTYAETISIYARLRGLRRHLLPFPFMPVGLIAQIAGRLTPVPTRIAGPLLGGMRSDSVVRDRAASRDFPYIRPIGYEASVGLALEQLSPGCFEFVWEISPTSFRIRQEGFFIEGQNICVDVPPEAIYRAITGLGGRSGWLFLNRLWSLRGFLDRLAGGPGLRGRMTGQKLVEGDVVDFYRVEKLEANHLVRLKAEMKAPGLGWMEWHIQPQPGGSVKLTQMAYFAPRGVYGFLYWYALYPVHHILFSGLLKALIRRAGEIENSSANLR